jgi:hypothetical protein
MAFVIESESGDHITSTLDSIRPFRFEPQKAIGKRLESKLSAAKTKAARNGLAFTNPFGCFVGCTLIDGRAAACLA